MGPTLPKPSVSPSLKRKRSSLKTDSESIPTRSSKKTASTKSKLSKKPASPANTDEKSRPRKGKKLRWGQDLPEDAGDDRPNVTKGDGDSNPESEEDEPKDSDVDETCLSIACHQNRIGAAYYDPAKCILYLLEDTQESPHFDLTKMLFEQVSPDIVLTSSRADDGLVSQCQDYSDETSTRFQIRPHREFVAERGKDRLLSLRILDQTLTDPRQGSDGSGDEPRNAYEFMRQRQDAQGGDPVVKKRHAALRAHNYSTMEAPLCLAAIGALLDHLVRTRTANDLDDDGIAGLDVLSIELLALNEVMQINADALSSLNVFSDENHASVHSSRTKEGLSLFGILDKTRTSLGRQLLRQWLLRPSLSLKTIAARHDAVECFVNPDNLGLVDMMQDYLRGIKNVPRMLGVLRKGRATWREWSALVKFTFNTVMLRETVTELCNASGIPIVTKLLSTLDVTKFQEMGTSVNDTIDWEASQNESRVCVKATIDPELDEKKNIYNSLSSFLSQVAVKVALQVPLEYRNSLNVLYFPQLGYLITVPLREEWVTKEDFDVVPGWVYQFSTEQQVYFKSQDMHDLDLHVGDLKSLIMDREIEIIHGLQVQILEFDEAVVDACHVCAELDCLLSLAAASRAYDFIRPIMVEENVLDIRGGRHPLQELCEATFVANDLYLAGGQGLGAADRTSDDGDSDSMVDFDLEGHQERSDNATRIQGEKRSVMICTGANACGKSVYLKQNALVPLMAQIGCFVPAEYARLGIIDKIFTRIQTRESVAKMQSAFMIDLAQVSLALRNCTSRSLILLDEFGKGTVATDGAGLLCGVLDHLLSRGTNCPKVISTTHFHEIFHHGLLKDHLPITFVHMKVIVGDQDLDSAFEDGAEEYLRAGQGHLEEEFTLLYQITPGLCLNSYAAHCALANGIPRPIVERARHVSDLLLKHELQALLDESMTADEEAELEEAEAIAKRFAGLDLSDETDIKARLAIVLGRTEEHAQDTEEQVNDRIALSY